MINLKNKSFLSLKDFSKEEIIYLINLADELKEKKKKNIYEKNLMNKNIALIFEKSSTRTRCSFTVAANDEGAFPEYLNHNDIQLGHKESVEDTARVLGRMFDGIAFRGFLQSTVEKLAKYSGVPVWNGLTDDDHPTQVLADFMTIREHLGRLEGVKLTYVGDGRNNMSNALMYGCAKVGLNYTVVTPKELYPSESVVNISNEFSKESGASINVTDSIDSGVKGADIIYSDVWCSMGEEAKSEERVKLLSPYQVNSSLMAKTGCDTLFMHCLPAVKGNEVTEDVFESKSSIVFDEAENRMHTIKAVMVATIRG